MCISLAELISSNFFASKVGAGNGFLHGRLPHDFYFLSWNEYILLYIEIVQFIYALFHQQASTSHFFSRAEELNIFCAVLPATSHELCLHFDIVFDTENMGLVYAQSSC